MLGIAPRKVSHHLHAYQPRENNPFTEKVNIECYRALADAEVFRNVSADFGPTLLLWLDRNDRATLDKIVEQDNGQMIGQPFTHRIMPDITFIEDIQTQIFWGKACFEHFFGRETQGMWLPESATSKRVLEEMAKQDIIYTFGNHDQRADDPESYSPGPFRIDLGKKDMIYFFFHPVSGQIANNGGGYLNNADHAMDFIAGMGLETDLFLAYDCETFGHHHKFTDGWLMSFPAAASRRKWSMEPIYSENGLRPEKIISFARIRDNTSWSCSHGIERWTNGCSCGGEGVYRRPLTEAMKELEIKVHRAYFGQDHIENNYAMRNEFIQVILDEKQPEELVEEHAQRNLTQQESAEAQLLLFAQYHLQLAYTSCGWWYGEPSLQTGKSVTDALTSAMIVDEIKGETNAFDFQQKIQHVIDISNPGIVAQKRKNAYFRNAYLPQRQKSTTFL